MHALSVADGRDLGSRYLLIEVIGQGGCGVVWRATERETGEQVAVKVLRRDLADAPDMLAHFVTEAEALRSVSHPHVLSLRDVVVEGGDLALVTDLIDGPSLRSVLDHRGALGAWDVGVLARQLAAGLAAVHAAGIVHADLKPQNILIGPTGARLADFGLARLLDGSTKPVRGGSRGYQAPEVVRGADPSPSSDVFALGLVLYETWIGALPRKRGPSAADRARLTVAAADQHGDLAQTVLDALAVDPRRRPAARTLACRLAVLPGVTTAPEDGGPEVSCQDRATTPRQGPGVTAGGRGGCGPLFEQYAGDSQPTVLQVSARGTRRPEPGVATRDYRKRRRSRLWRVLLTFAAFVLAVVGGVLARGSAPRAEAGDVADVASAAWFGDSYPAPTGWLCGSSSGPEATAAGFRLRVCVLADRSDHVLGKITAELAPSSSGGDPKHIRVDARIGLGPADGTMELAASDRCSVVLTAARPTASCALVELTVRQAAEIRAFGTGWLRGEASRTQEVSTPAVTIRSQRVT